MHLVYADDGAEYSVFRMDDRVSIVRLVIFLWNIREFLGRITGKLESATEHVVQSIKDHCLMHWRADSIPEARGECEGSVREGLVSHWLNGLVSVEDEA